MAIFWNSGVFCRIPVIFTEIEGRNKKRRPVIILAPMVFSRRLAPFSKSSAILKVFCPKRQILEDSHGFSPNAKSSLVLKFLARAPSLQQFSRFLGPGAKSSTILRMFSSRRQILDVPEVFTSRCRIRASPCLCGKRPKTTEKRT